MVKYKALYAILEQRFSNLIVVSGSGPDLPPHMWLPHQPGLVKLIFDGSFNPMTDLAGIGSVIRNTASPLITAYARKVQET